MRYVTIALMAMALPALAATDAAAGARGGPRGEATQQGNASQGHYLTGWRTSLYGSYQFAPGMPTTGAPRFEPGGQNGGAYGGLTPGGNGSWNASPFR